MVSGGAVRVPARQRRLGKTVVVASVGVLIGFVLASVLHSPLPFALAVLAAVLAVALASFREPASMSRWIARASAVLAGLALFALVAGSLVGSSGGDPWAGLALVVVAAPLAGVSLVLAVISALVHLATRHRTG